MKCLRVIPLPSRKTWGVLEVQRTWTLRFCAVEEAWRERAGQTRDKCLWREKRHPEGTVL